MVVGARVIDASTGASHAEKWFFENASELVGVASSDGVIIHVNAAWEKATGWTLQELVGRKLREFLHPESQAALLEVRRLLALGGRAESAIRLARKGGGWVWLEGTATAGPNGELMGMLRDVSELRLRADELDRARQVQSLLSGTAGVGLWRYDPRTEQIEWSAEWLAMLAEAGVSIDTAEQFAKVCHPDDLERVLAIMNAAIDHGSPGAFDHRFHDQQGNWLWTRVHVRAEPAIDGGYIVHGLSQNITAQFEALSSLSEARRDAESQAQRLRIALEAGRAAVVEIDYEQRTVWMSPQFVELVGPAMTFDEAKRALWPFVHREDAPVVEAAVRRWLAGGDPEPLEVRAIRPDGSERWIAIYTEIQKDDDQHWRRSVGLVMDIDSRKRQELSLVAAERAAQCAVEAKGQFLANMSHEIRTPMNGVLGILHLLKAQSLSEDARSMLDQALGCGETLQALLNDVVDYTQIEAGQVDLAIEPVEPLRLVQEVVELLRPEALAKGLDLTLMAADLPSWVATSPTRLRQALMKLIGNAVKFTERGSVVVTPQYRFMATGRRLRFEIEDTGVGISEDAQAHLFERFQQADTSTTRRHGGSGLGLAITRTLARAMGGDVGFASQIGRGSTFWLEVEAPEVEAPACDQGVTEGVLDGLCVLVVEDNPTNRMVATKLLEGLGACVQTAEDGEHGVRSATQGAFDLILMDIQMPGIDGVEATRRIRASATPAARIPIIALTANVLPHQCDSYFAAGMNGVVPKPISPVGLLSEIARLSEVTLFQIG